MFVILVDANSHAAEAHSTLCTSAAEIHSEPCLRRWLIYGFVDSPVHTSLGTYLLMVTW